MVTHDFHLATSLRIHRNSSSPQHLRIRMLHGSVISSALPLWDVLWISTAYKNDLKCMGGFCHNNGGVKLTPQCWSWKGITSWSLWRCHENGISERSAISGCSPKILKQLGRAIYIYMCVCVFNRLIDVYIHVYNCIYIYIYIGCSLSIGKLSTLATVDPVMKIVQAYEVATNITRCSSWKVNSVFSRHVCISMELLGMIQLVQICSNQHTKISRYLLTSYIINDSLLYYYLLAFTISISTCFWWDIFWGWDQSLPKPSSVALHFHRERSVALPQGFNWEVKLCIGRGHQFH